MNTLFDMLEPWELCEHEVAGCDIVTGVGVTYEAIFMKDGSVQCTEYNWEGV